MTPDYSARVACVLDQGKRLRTRCAEAIALSRTLRAQASELAATVGKHQPFESIAKRTTDPHGNRDPRED